LINISTPFFCARKFWKNVKKYDAFIKSFLIVHNYVLIFPSLVDNTAAANPELTDKSLQNRFRGFAAGMASGITKLAVGHPFGM
jgi:hypothetical protein